MIERVILILILVAVLFSAGVYVGKSMGAREHAEGEVERIRADTRIVDKLRVEDNKREVIYRDRSKVIREMVDDCLSQPIAGPVLDQLRNATVGTAARSASY